MRHVENALIEHFVSYQLTTSFQCMKEGTTLVKFMTILLIPNNCFRMSKCCLKTQHFELAFFIYIHHSKINKKFAVSPNDKFLLLSCIHIFLND